MYNRLKGEIIIGGYKNVKDFWTKNQDKLSFSYPSFVRKLNRNGSEFTFGEAVEIKKALGSEVLLEDLFAWEDN